MRVGPCPLLPLQFTVEFYKLLLDCYPLTSVFYSSSHNTAATLLLASYLFSLQVLLWFSNHTYTYHYLTFVRSFLGHYDFFVMFITVLPL